MDILITPRLTLRPPAWPDAHDIADGLSNWDVARMLAVVPAPYFTRDAKDWIEQVSARPDALVYTIHRERLIGVVSIEGDGPEPRLGYWLNERAQGQGYMTEAATALIGHAFGKRKLAGIASSVFIDNPASMRVQQKLGFRQTGISQSFSRARDTMVDTLMTRLDAAHWHNRNAAEIRAAA